jgi:hypothetical protein
LPAWRNISGFNPQRTLIESDRSLTFAGVKEQISKNGALGVTKIGGILYYKYDDIIRMMEGDKTCNTKVKANVR